MLAAQKAAGTAEESRLWPHQANDSRRDFSGASENRGQGTLPDARSAGDPSMGWIFPRPIAAVDLAPERLRW